MDLKIYTLAKNPDCATRQLTKSIGFSPKLSLCLPSLGDLAPLHAGPHHEGVHRTLDVLAAQLSALRVLCI
jgi:hypothetical protein